MGKAALDLPEPAEATSAAPENAGTDDLLAQLAGQEIDRLLADADVPREGGAAPASAQSTPAAKAETPVADSKPAPVQAAPAPVQASAAPVQSSPARLSSRDPEPPTAPAQPAPTAPTESLLPNLEAPRAEQAIGDIIGTLDPELEEATREPTEAAPTERSALDAALGPAAATLTAAELAAESDDDDAPLPLYLRPIEWLNACFDAIPEAILEAAGKIAILTMVNAVAVLLYVLFFRHH